MPRKTRTAAPAAPVESRPFADGSTAPYAALAPDAKLAVAESIRAAKLAGASGNEMRATFGERLTGPARRKVLREHGLEAGAIARSYVEYRDGEARTGTRHAREHGANAGALRAAAAREQAASADLALIRKALREAGASVPRREDRARAAYEALLLAPAS
jgi:hypothetical protein